MPGKTAALLIVEDDDQARDALAQLLNCEGYRTTTAKNGAQALAKLASHPFDLVLLDVILPGSTGLEVLAVLRRRHPATDLPVIMTTGQDSSEDIVRALTVGANDYVTKPLDLPVLLARIRTQLALRQTVAQVVALEASVARHNAELESANVQLTAANSQMRGDLEAAARVQEAFLPPAQPTLTGAVSAWLFKPCSHLAGDMFNVFSLDEHHVGFYLLDVSGHGVAAALLAVSLSRVLDPLADARSLLVETLEDHPGYRLVPPGEVADHLNRRFAWDAATEQFFTLLYGILDTQSGEVRFVCAGHPRPIVVAGGVAASLTGTSGLPIGIGSGGYQEEILRLQPGDRLYLYSDGASEVAYAIWTMFGIERLVQALRQQHGQPLAAGLDGLWTAIQDWSGAAAIRDDVSVLGLEFAPAPTPKTRRRFGARTPIGMAIA